MPRNVRNFWIELDVDGRSTPVATGPRRKDGGFSLTIRQRDDGDIVTPLHIVGVATDNGALVLRVEGGVNNSFKVITNR